VHQAGKMPARASRIAKRTTDFSGLMIRNEAQT
jgi:hypothetical protein